MSPEENYRFVKAFNQRMGPIIRDHHGFVNQFFGDSLMAIFSQRPEDALNAAIAMQKRLSTYNQVLKANPEDQPARLFLKNRAGLSPKGCRRIGREWR